LNSQKFIELLKKKNLLKIIDEKLDVNLEIPHIAYIETKKKNQKVLLFTNPVDKEKNIEYKIPVLMNIFNNETLKLIFKKDVELIAKEIHATGRYNEPGRIGSACAARQILVKLK